MNYLAHLSLSLKDAAIMTGNFIADDIPRKEEPHVPADIAKGIDLHRKIDELTDDHESFRKAMLKLRPHHRKYAPVVIDILNDHLLSRNWEKFHPESVEEFHQLAYRNLSEQVLKLPPKASLHVHTLLEYQYLKAYDTKIGLENVLARMDKRTRFPSDFKSAADHLYADLDFFEEQFMLLYRALYDEVKAHYMPSV